MGATTFIATDEDDGWAEKHARSLDLIVCTVSSARMPLPQYLELLGTGGRFVQVGAPEEEVPGFPAFGLIMRGGWVGGSSIGSVGEIEVCGFDFGGGFVRGGAGLVLQPVC